MNNLNPLNHIQTAIAVIDKEMNIFEANAAYAQRNNLKIADVIGTKCFNSAYQFNEICSKHSEGACPVQESFKTKKVASTIHHYWINDRAIVEEISATPILDENGEVSYVVEEFRDITKLLGLKKGIISICSYCKKIHDNDEKWVSFETYLIRHTGAHFSHGVCNECNDILRKEFGDK